MGIVALCIGGSILASVITTKILATHYFEIVDGYVRDMCNMTKEFVDETKTKICKYPQMTDQEE